MTIYPAIQPHIFSGEEAIIATSSSVSDYWRWAHSSLVDNAERGIFAEYLIHMAMGSLSPVRVNWDRCDVISPEGIAIEVKASGYLQSWAQDRLSTINFSIRPAYGWDSETNIRAAERIRQSDVYVFCVLAHKDQESLNPLDTKQWRFYVLPTRVLNEKRPHQKTITLSGVIQLGAVETDFADLRHTILSVAGI